MKKKMSNTHTIEELKQFQAMPLEVKIALTKSRIRSWINEFGVDGVYVSFSGGKDSTVLLHIVREEYPDVPAVFVDTGLEYPEIRDFVKTFDNVTWIKPKMNFKQVIMKYGYPMISKEVSECVYGARKYLTQVLEEMTIATNERTNERTNGITINTSTIKCEEKASIAKKSGGGTTISLEKLEDLASILNKRMLNREGGNNQRLAQMLGLLTADQTIKANIPEEDRSAYSQEKYKFFLEAPFEISNRCCNVMKKEPAHRYTKETGRYPITAQMACESRLRTQKWLQSGCNGFELKNPISNPMSFWLEQDVLQYIKQNNIEIASVYGEVVTDYGCECEGQIDICELGLADDTRKLKTTKCKRTGCMFCGYGCHLNNDQRFVMMKETHPKQYEYIMKPIEKGGLGYKQVIDWINENGNMNIKY